MTQDDFVLQIQHFCATRDLKTVATESMIHTTGHPRANLFFPGSVIPTRDQLLPPRTPVRCASAEYRIRIEDINSGAIINECSLHDSDATSEQIAEWLVSIHRHYAYDECERCHKTNHNSLVLLNRFGYHYVCAACERDFLSDLAHSVTGLVTTLAASKQGWSTDGTGWLNGEDGTAIFLPGLMGATVTESWKSEE